MSFSMSSVSGDGVHTPYIAVDALIPDAGRVVTINAVVKYMLTPVVYANLVTLTAPVTPVSGTTYWIVQADYVAGTLSIKSDTTDFPPPDDGNVWILRQALSLGASLFLTAQGGWEAPSN